MKRLATSLIAACFAAATLNPLALAQDGMKPAPAKGGGTGASAATLKCPSCGMPMPAKKTAAFPQAIKINGKTYYCCSACPSGKQAAAYRKAHKGQVLSIGKPATKDMKKD